MEMEEFPLQDIAPILMEMINETMTSKKNQMSQNQPVMKSLQ